MIDEHHVDSLPASFITCCLSSLLWEAQQCQDCFICWMITRWWSRRNTVSKMCCHTSLLTWQLRWCFIIICWPESTPPRPPFCCDLIVITNQKDAEITTKWCRFVNSLNSCFVRSVSKMTSKQISKCLFSEWSSDRLGLCYANVVAAPSTLRITSSKLGKNMAATLLFVRTEYQQYQAVS